VLRCSVEESEKREQATTTTTATTKLSDAPSLSVVTAE
jgi:hypothetical protein